MRFSAFDKSGKAARLDRRGPPGLGGDLLPELPRHRQGRRAGRRPDLVDRPRPGGPVPAQRPHPPQRAGRARTSRRRSSARACHYSPALDLAGTGPSAAQAGHRHDVERHARLPRRQDGRARPTPRCPWAARSRRPPTQSCYQCHPGATTQCLRGAMTTTVDCQNCHGNMAAVGGQYPLLAGGSIDGTNDGERAPPLAGPPALPELPRQRRGVEDLDRRTRRRSPPTGCASTNAFRNGDASASPILATNKRFAEEPGKLYRKSKGHGGLACEACHGSTHAIWSANANDNVAATQLQGHAGTIGECSTCHQAASHERARRAARDAPGRRGLGGAPTTRTTFTSEPRRLPGLPRRRLPGHGPLEDVRHADPGRQDADRRREGRLLHLPQRSERVASHAGAPAGPSRLRRRGLFTFPPRSSISRSTSFLSSASGRTARYFLNSWTAWAFCPRSLCQ